MSKPYCIVSDLHFHNWSQFSYVDPDGVNSRLRISLNEFERAADELLKAGGTRMVIPGDVLHVRGSVDPTVFNPVHDAVRRVLQKGVYIDAIVGNHDLASKETSELGNSFQALGALTGFTVITKPTLKENIAFIPWCSTIKGLNEAVEWLITNEPQVTTLRDQMDLVMHAGIDGALDGMPDHGFSSSDVEAWCFRRAFSGHYHNFKDFGNDVYSIGASQHQTWSDVGTKAGFLLVYPERVEWRASHAPEFVDISPDTDPDEWPLIVDGNYVRVRGFKMSNEEISLMRAELEGLGAKGVNFQVARETATMRTGGAPATALTLEASLAKYINDKIADLALAAAVQDACKDVLSVVNTAA